MRLRRQLRRASDAWRRVTPYLGESRRLVPILVGASILSGVAQALALVVLAGLAVELTDGSDVFEFDGLGASFETSTGTALALAGLAVVAMVAFQLVAAFLAARMMTESLTTARSTVLASFLGASWDVQSHDRAGELQDLFTTHMGKVAGGVSHATQLIVAVCNLGVLLAVAVAVSPGPALGALFGMLALSAALRPLTSLSRRKATTHAAANVRFVTALTETVGLAREVRTFGVNGQVFDELTTLQDQVARPHRQLGFLHRSVHVIYQGVALLVLVVGIGVLFALDIDRLPALGAMVLLLLRSISYGQQAQTAVHHLGEMAPYLDQVQARRALYESDPVNDGDQRLASIDTLEFRDVSFSYPGGQAALSDLSIEIRAGEMIGVVGPSGSGKSTLVQLLLRLRAPQQGSYLVNGQPAAAYRLEDWYAAASSMPQEPLLVSGTIAENIAFHRTGYDRSAIEDAARAAHVHDEIMALSEGYETVLGGSSSRVSGGQAQRICLARALLASPRLLVLDEPTSALDPVSEAAISDTLESLSHRTTLVVIAHRLSTVQRCDRLLVLEDGRLVADGPPSDLALDDNYFATALGIAERRGAPSVR